MTPAEWVTQVLRRVAADGPRNFAGLGLVVYRPPLELPVAALVPPDRLPAPDAGGDLETTVALLCRLSDISSPLHDGFHLVDARALTVTHLCQFFAPPVPSSLPASLPPRPVGARFMAAFLGSLLPSVVMTAIMSDRNEAIVVERGVIRALNLSLA